MTPEEIDLIKSLALSNAKSIQALTAEGQAQRQRVDELVKGIQALSQVRQRRLEADELNADIKSLFQEILGELRSERTDD